MSKKKKTRRLRKRVLVSVAVLFVAVALGAWIWQRTLPLRDVDVRNAHHATEEAVLTLVDLGTPAAAEDTSLGDVALYSIDPGLVANRAERHPWVREANVRRLPTGTLSIHVEEREPAALVMKNGIPSHYLDAEGYAMPLESAAEHEAAFMDVPLITGSAPEYHPTQPVQRLDEINGEALRETLAALASADPAIDALISDIKWGASGGVLYTVPAGGHPSIPVRLGRRDVDNQLQRLRAFWDQAVLPQPSVSFQSVDLRFEGQVVTRETHPGDLSADSTEADPV